MTRFFWILAAPLLAGAQVANIEVAAPTLGYVLDANARSLRTVEGVPATAAISVAVNVGTPLDWAAVAPNRRYALGGNSASQNVLLVRLDGASGASVPLGISSLRTVAFSPTGQTLAGITENGVEIWTGMPDAPTRLAIWNFTESASKLAVSDDGNAVVAISGGRLWRLQSDGPQVLSEGEFNDALFLRNSHSLFASASNRIVMWNKVSSDAPGQTFGNEESGIVAPQSIALSADESALLVVGQGGVSLVDRQSLQARRVASEEFRAEGVWRAQGNAVFLFQSKSGSPVWLLDGDADEPRLVAVSGRAE